MGDAKQPGRLWAWLGQGSGDASAKSALPPPLHLAYLGDAVWELHVRTVLVESERGKLSDIHHLAVKRVQAGAQADRLRSVEDELTEAEREIVRRGRNASPKGPRGSDPAAYRYSTGFECLLGYLYWTGQTERLREILYIADRQERGDGR
ncbi:MAG: Mini-ribonuclease 3 [Firmicutes bacterium]|nr:Mini-ribonuclease 3 [Bacillota bacterium]